MSNGGTPLGPYMAAADAVIGAAVLTVIAAFIGYWIDGKLHTTPLFSLAFVFIGMILGLARMVLKAKQNSGKPPSGSHAPPKEPEDR